VLANSSVDNQNPFAQFYIVGAALRSTPPDIMAKRLSTRRKRKRRAGKLIAAGVGVALTAEQRKLSMLSSRSMGRLAFPSIVRTAT
jgi:hypothetical protein